MASPLWLGLITEGSVSATTRLFLGHQKTNEKHLIRDTQSLWSWFSSRRKVREGIHEYLELELGACDPEVILRNSKVHWIRKSTHGYLLDQAIKFMREKNDKGFIFQEPSEAHRVALAEILKVSAPCRESESAIMNEKLRDAMKPGRYESNPMSAITAPDFLALRKYVEEDTVLEQFCTNETISDTGLHFSHVPDLERKLKHFLSRKLVEERLDALLQTFIPPDRLKPGLTKSEIKSLNYLFPNEYSRAHYIPQYRPLEMAALYRVHASNRFQSDSWYAKCLWGHLFMRMSLHPGYLLSIGQSWLSGMFQCDTVQALPQHLAMAAPVLIDSLPATTFHAQYALTDTKYTSWQQYPLCIPLLRVLPLVGSQIADDLVAELNVRKCWSSLNIPLLSRLDDPDVTHRIKCMMGALVTQNVESALEGAIEASKLMMTHEPSPTNDDQESMKTRALR